MHEIYGQKTPISVRNLQQMQLQYVCVCDCTTQTHVRRKPCCSLVRLKHCSWRWSKPSYWQDTLKTQRFDRRALKYTHTHARTVWFLVSGAKGNYFCCISNAALPTQTHTHKAKLILAVVITQIPTAGQRYHEMKSTFGAICFQFNPFKIQIVWQQ